MKKIITLLIITGSIILAFYLHRTPTIEATADVDCSTYAHKVFCLTNDARAKAGKKRLLYSYELEKVSMAKSKDMCKRSYFSHDYNGEKWTRFIEQSGINYRKAAENLAKGYSTPENAVQGLIDSPKHYKAIIGDYTYIGVYTEPCGGLNYTTQTFAKL